MRAIALAHLGYQNLSIHLTGFSPNPWKCTSSNLNPEELAWRYSEWYFYSRSRFGGPKMLSNIWVQLRASVKSWSISWTLQEVHWCSYLPKQSQLTFSDTWRCFNRGSVWISSSSYQHILLWCRSTKSSNLSVSPSTAIQSDSAHRFRIFSEDILQPSQSPRSTSERKQNRV
jgi:hypothetical protein